MSAGPPNRAADIPAAAASDAAGEVVLHVCTTCRGAADPEARPGRRLLDEIEAMLAQEPVPGLRVEAVECLSVCKRPCTVAVASPGRWTYVYGDLDPEASAATILAGLGLYAGTADGIVPWRERPDAFKKGVVARIPPLSARPSFRGAEGEPGTHDWPQRPVVGFASGALRVGFSPAASPGMTREAIIREAAE